MSLLTGIKVSKLIITISVSFVYGNSLIKKTTLLGSQENIVNYTEKDT